MKRMIPLACAVALFCGGAAAQSGPDGLIAALIGPTGPVKALTKIPAAGSLKPLVDSLAGPTGVIQGQVGSGLNTLLNGLLSANGQQLQAGLQGTLSATLSGAVQGLLHGQGLNRIIGPGQALDLSYGGDRLVGLTYDTGIALPGLGLPQ